MDNKLNVKVDGGNSITINVIDIIELENVDKKYIVYSIDESGSDDMYISILNEDEKSYSLITIETEEELKKVTDYMINVHSKVGE